MATQYIKYAKKCEKKFFFQIIRREGVYLFWLKGGYAHVHKKIFGTKIHFIEICPVLQTICH